MMPVLLASLSLLRVGATPDPSRIGIASWHDFGRPKVCASNFIRIGRAVRVEYRGRTVDVVVVSTGPHERLGRIIDLSPDAFA
jgi:hypothetical protein